MPIENYPTGSFVYYRDNYGDMIIGQVKIRHNDLRHLTVYPRWFAEEPIVMLPLRRITGSKLNRIPVSIVEKVELHAPE